MKKKVVVKFRKEEATEENIPEENRKSQLKSRVLALLSQISSERQKNERVKELSSTEEAEMNIMMDGEFRTGGSGEWHKMDERVVEVLFLFYFFLILILFLYFYF
jgi:hypothetical protein